MMKKVLLLLLVLTLLLSLIGCAGSTPAPSAAPAPTPQAPAQTSPEVQAVPFNPELPHAPDPSKLKAINIPVSAMAVGQSTNVMTNNLVSVMVKYLPAGSTMPVATDSVGNATSPFLISAGTAWFVMGEGVPCSWALAGITPGLDGRKAENVYSLGSADGTSRVQIIFGEKFHKSTGYTTLEKVLADKHPVKISCKTTNSFGEMTLRMLLESLGYSYEDIKSWGGDIIPVEQTQAIDMIKDGRADVFVDFTTQFNANVIELNLTTDCLNVQMEDATLEKLYELGYTVDTVEKDVYRQGYPAQTIKTAGGPTSYLVSGDLPDEYAYLLTQAICENRDELMAVNANFELFHPETSCDEERMGAPVHPGALLYYQDAGLPIQLKN
jgi:predicted small lipoprotein YifL